MKKLIFMILVTAFSSFGQGKPFIVDYSDIVEPCVMINQAHKPYGFDIDLFNKVAEKIGLTNYQYREVQFKDIFTDVKSGVADLGIGGITITSKREKYLDFTHPYLEADIKVLVKADKENGLVAVFHSIWQKNVFLLVLAVLIFALLCSFVLWVLERNNPENSKMNPFKLIFDFFYMTIVTVSTVGYGDRCAKTIIGKALVVAIILSGLAIFGAYVGTVTTNIQVDRSSTDIKCTKDLKDKVVATVDESYSVDVIAEENIGSACRSVKNIYRAVGMLRKGQVDAVIFDAPPLLSIASKEQNYIVAPFSVRTQNYGFVLPIGSQWRTKINQALLELQESGEYQRIYDKWF